MIRIDRLCVSPVKSLGLNDLQRAYLDKPGIPGDRAFFIRSERGDFFTQRECPRLVQVRPAYDVDAGHLAFDFPDGRSVQGVPELGAEVATSAFGQRSIPGRLVLGDWSDALSKFVGEPVQLVKAGKPGLAFDAYPISLCSTASLDALAQAAGRDSIDGRRFRQNIYLSGATAHQEDEWIGAEIRIGSALIRVKQRDARCVMTTLSPDTGETDLDTLKIISSYRTDQPRQANFGVYCTVVQPGEVSLGDQVSLDAYS
jgi:uncharacterized protein YcbX